MEIIIQGIGYLGTLCHLTSYMMKKNKLLFMAQMLGCFIFFTQYLLLGAFSGAVMNLIGLTRCIVFMQGNKTKKPWVLAVLLIAVCAGVIFTWAGPISILPLIGMLVSTAAMYSNDGKTIRFAQLLVNSPCWLAYNIIVGSQGGALCEALTITSTIVSFFKYGLNGFEPAGETGKATTVKKEASDESGKMGVRK